MVQEERGKSDEWSDGLVFLDAADQRRDASALRQRSRRRLPGNRAVLYVAGLEGSTSYDEARIMLWKRSRKLQRSSDAEVNSNLRSPSEEIILAHDETRHRMLLWS